MTLSLASIAPALAAAPPPLSHLVLASKPHSGDQTPDFSTWSFAMWGQLDYYTPWATFTFAFDGHGLAPSTEYTLIYYPDPWPGNGLICIASGASDGSGDIILHQELPGVDTGALPIATDYNADPAKTTYPNGVTGAKIWLVLSADVDCQGQKMTAWNPTHYLFELWLIQYSLPVPPAPVEHCITRNFWNLNTHALDHVTVCYVGLPVA